MTIKMGLAVGVETEKFSPGLSVCSELNPCGIICCCSQGIHVLPQRHSLLPRCWNRTTFTFHWQLWQRSSMKSHQLWMNYRPSQSPGCCSRRGVNGTGFQRKSWAVLTNNLHLGYRKHRAAMGTWGGRAHAHASTFYLLLTWPLAVLQPSKRFMAMLDKNQKWTAFTVSFEILLCCQLLTEISIEWSDFKPLLWKHSLMF